MGCGGVCLDEDEESSGCGGSCEGPGGGRGDSAIGRDESAMWVQIFLVGEMADHGVCAKHAGVTSDVTRLAC